MSTPLEDRPTGSAGSIDKQDGAQPVRLQVPRHRLGSARALTHLEREADSARTVARLDRARTGSAHKP